METEFISIPDKANLQIKLEQGDKEAIKIVLVEIQRLEAIIRDYELGMEMLQNKFKSKTFKYPQIANK